jgi:addiction module HigA family antidote
VIRGFRCSSAPVNEIIHNKRAVTLDTSLRLGRYFGQSPRFWLNLQTECDLRNAASLIKKITREVRPLSAAVSLRLRA